MSNRGLHHYILVAITCTALVEGCTPTTESFVIPQRPNVLFIAIDDLRPALGCYGDAYAITPSIDSFALEAVTFNKAYTQQAVCAPSRNTLMTGLRPDELGIHDLGTFFRASRPEVVTMTQHFMNAGYHAEGLGKIYHTVHGNKNDQHSWSIPHKGFFGQKGIGGHAHGEVELKDHSDVAITERALERISMLRDSAFFLMVGFYKPHLPFVSTPEFAELYDSINIDVLSPSPPKNATKFSTANWGEMRKYNGIPREGPVDDELAVTLRKSYYACVSLIDAQVGRILRHLKNLDLYDNTIIVIWGDHGYKLGDYGDWCKHTNFEIDTRIPLIIRIPGLTSGGMKSEEIVETVDIYPTLAEAADLAPRQELQGTSFLSNLANPKRITSSVAFSQYPRHKGNVMGTSIRTQNWRYTRWTSVTDSKLLSIELYDHRDNSAELINLAGDPKYKRKIERLEEQFHAEYARSHHTSMDTVHTDITK